MIFELLLTSHCSSAIKAGRLSDIRWDIPGTSWQNAETRTYEIQLDTVEVYSNPRLTETMESKERRGKKKGTYDTNVVQQLFQAFGRELGADFIPNLRDENLLK